MELLIPISTHLPRHVIFMCLISDGFFFLLKLQTTTNKRIRLHIGILKDELRCGSWD